MFLQSSLLSELYRTLSELARASLLFLSVVAGIAFADVAAQPQDQQRSSASDNIILVMGDSLSAAYGIDVEKGWVTLLQQELKRNQLDYEVINASISGETSSGGKRRIDALLDKWQPRIVILELGGNDGLRGVPTKTIEANLDSMITLSATSSAEILLLGMQIPPNYGPRYTAAFHQVFHTLAEKHSISLVPFFLENVATRSDWMQADGIHPTADAQRTMLRNVWPLLQQLL